MNNKIVLNGNDKVARTAINIENADSFISVNDDKSNEICNVEAMNIHSEKVNDYVKKLENYSDTLKQELSNINFDNLEILPLFDNILISPYKTNPFQRIVSTESGLILDNAGMTPEYTSNESGEREMEKSAFYVGVVVEVGKTCSYLKEGDIVICLKTSSVDIPFYRQDLKLVPEKRVLVVINNNLKNRFNG